MSQFPGLQPSGRALTPATVPMNAFTSVSGKETRVIMGDSATGAELTLSFDTILEAVAQRVLNHYRTQLGVALQFDLPPEVYAGWTEYINEFPTGQKWRYAGPPNVEFVAPGIMSLSVSLVGLI